MRILLISSFTMAYVSRKDISPPLSLLCLASALRAQGHEPTILDLNVIMHSENVDRETFYIDAIHKAILEILPGMIGINCLLTANFPFIRKAAKSIKARLPKIPVVIGGIHPTLFAKDIMENCPCIDAIAMGEGELQAVALANVFESGDYSLIYNIGSLAFRDFDGHVMLTAREGFIKQLDLFPNPAWDLVNIEDYYRDHSNWYNPRGLNIKMSVPIQTSRSCVYDCSFCSSQSMMGRGLRLRSPKRVVDEMQMLYDNYGMNYFGFVDDNLTFKKSHIMEICGEIVQRGMNIQFESFTGFHIESIDEEIVDAMVEAGCVYAIMPIEHGSDYMRNKVIGKHLPREQIFRVAELYKKYDLLTRGFFIMGFPEDTRDTLMETYNMILELGLDINNVFSLIPFPGTKLFQQSFSENLFLEKNSFNNLWEGKLDLNALQKPFYIKPYDLTIEELLEFRHRFDELYLFSSRAKQLGSGQN